MTKRTRIYAPAAAIILALSIHTAGLAQTSLQAPPAIVEQAPALNPAIADAQTQARPASWQGKKVALNGRDVVSYFQADKPKKGSKKYAASWDDTTWRFSSEENRDEFLKDPQKYVPEFGGYCPVALSKNHAKVGFSKHYTVVNDRLYLNYDKRRKDKFRSDPTQYIVRAQLNF